ncbi:hypothetical protein T265_06540 [Opisthorchis viverrini]|uniref:Uncharacterized protein n=1 Tax=Opisthorchis viverrini TaxID=6198 RepID=A0A074ZK21_OPIVI|nr:hypothetical protein T265_06540 [Opisthorchis viverrini]KER26122.1 hypothetical protein T265_06540 [Opisthorchis viverrini]
MVQLDDVNSQCKNCPMCAHTTHEVAEDSSRAHDRFRPSWDERFSWVPGRCELGGTIETGASPDSLRCSPTKDDCNRALGGGGGGGEDASRVCWHS